MTWWLNDYVHRVNILTPRWTEVGVGVSVRESGEMIFVTVFSAGRDASATVAVASSGAGTVAPPVAVPAGGIEYVIQPGDTLLDVAYRYELDWTEIARANAITDDRLLQIGQVLRIPDGDGNYTVGASSLGGTGGPGGYPGLPYEIQPYETLVSIAAKHGTTWEELARINGLGEFSILQIGQTIQVPVPLSEEDPIGLDQEESAAQSIEAGQEAPVVQEEEPAEDLPVLHLVQTGDTVFGIALAYSVDWQELLAINSLSEASLLQPGQPIRLR